MDFEHFNIQTKQAWEERRSQLRGSFNTAINLLQEAKEADYKLGIADCSKILGYCYWRFSDYSKSLDNSLLAIEIYKSLNDKKGEADTLNSVGAVYMFQNNNEKRLECNLNCLKLREEIGDVNGVSGSMNNIGETYFEMSDYENAQKWLEDCLAYEHSSIDSKAWANHNLGRIQQEKRNWKEAKVFFLKCLELTAIDTYDILTCETYIKLGELTLDEQDYAESKDFSNKAFALAERIGSKENKKTALLLLSSAMEKTNDTEEALKYHKQYHLLHEEIFNEENNQKIKDIGYQYEIDQISKEAEIERLKKIELGKAYQEIEYKNQVIQQKNKDITDSIRYAKKIQQALLLPESHISNHLPEHFILFKPKDIVSGDFYWASEKENLLYLAVSDCTGHGVPGAFLTVLGTTFLNDIISRDGMKAPSDILEELRNMFVDQLGQSETRDGMDISLICVDLSTKEFQWAGAIRPLLIFRKESLTMETISGDKQSICYVEKDEPFTNIHGTLNEGDIIYLFSDGYADQFGGDKGKKFKTKKLINLLSTVHDRPFTSQKEIINSTFEDWKGALEQIDDVCLVSMKF